jgi:F-type H+-transporting ATPase subunit epsilon
MATFELKLITPVKIVKQEPIVSITAPASEGIVTILPRHQHYFTLLKEGIITIRREDKSEEFYAIGKGYLETDGLSVTILVSEAYNQDALDEKLVHEAIEQAKKLLAETKDTMERSQALSSLRRAEIDFELIGKRKARSHVSQNG